MSELSGILDHTAFQTSLKQLLQLDKWDRELHVIKYQASQQYLSGYLLGCLIVSGDGPRNNYGKFSTRFLDSYSICAYYSGEIILARNLAQYLLDWREMTANDYSRVESNLRLFEKKLRKLGKLPAIRTLDSQAPQLNVMIKVVNLDRRPDRWSGMITKMRQAGLVPPKSSEFSEVEGNTSDFSQYRFSAVDGKTHTFSDEEKQIFEGNTFYNKTGVLGVSLSNIRLWKLLTESSEATHLLVLEDDIEFAEDFWTKYQHTIYLIQQIENRHESHLVYLGVTLGLANKPKMLYSRECSEVNLREYSPTEKQNPDEEIWIGGCFGYIISKGGAQLLLNRVNEIGMKQPVDNWMFSQFSHLSVFKSEPHIIYSTVFNGGQNGHFDSDTQLSGPHPQFNT